MHQGHLAQQSSYCQLPRVDMSTDTFRLVDLSISNHEQKLDIVFTCCGSDILVHACLSYFLLVSLLAH